MEVAWVQESHCLDQLASELLETWKALLQQKFGCTITRFVPPFLPHSVENRLSKNHRSIGQPYLIYNSSKPMANPPKACIQMDNMYHPSEELIRILLS